MLCCKYKQLILILLVISQSSLAAKFSAKECLDAKFKTEIVHKGKFFGLITNTLKIEKNICQLNIYYKNILETVWKIDICREPIHLKVHSKGSETFYKRVAKCVGDASISYCKNLAELKASIHDFALIYAKGERENLTSAHGQTYCTHLLLEKYLVAGKLFSTYQEPHDIFEKEGRPQAFKEQVTEKPLAPMAEVVPATPKIEKTGVFETSSESESAAEEKPKF